MKNSANRSGEDVVTLLKPLFNVASPYIRQHLIDPDVVLVLAGVHPATQIILKNHSIELFHELRTINLILKKNGVRIKVSTKSLRKEINNLQRKATIVIESLNGYSHLQKKLFPAYKVNKFRTFNDLDKWRESVEKNNDDLELVVLGAVEDGEISVDNLRLITQVEQDNLLNEFLNIKDENTSKFFSEDKFFNLLHRVNAESKMSDLSFDSLTKNIQIIIKNSHHLSQGLKNEALTEATLQTLLDMLDSKYSVVKNLAIKILNDNRDSIKNKVENSSGMMMHELEQNIYKEAILKINRNN